MRVGPTEEDLPAAPQAAQCAPRPTRLLAAHNPQEFARSVAPWKTPVGLAQDPGRGYVRVALSRPGDRRPSRATRWRRLADAAAIDACVRARLCQQLAVRGQ